MNHLVKTYFRLMLFYLLFFALFNTNVTSFAQTNGLDDLSNVIDSVSEKNLEKPVSNKNGKEKVSEEKNLEKNSQELKDVEAVDSAEEQEEEKVKYDPAQNYKLVAIYLIGKQPRALIKNILIPEEGIVEYRIGDFLDEFQTLSVSKITLNPTARVEIIDENGLTYLIKPSANNDKQSGTTTRTTQGTKSLPSYFPSTQAKKSKSKKDTTATTDSTGADSFQAPSDSTVKQVAPQDTTTKKREGDASQPQQPQAASLKAVSSPGGAQTTREQSAPKADSVKSTDRLERERPSNPFE